MIDRRWIRRCTAIALVLLAAACSPGTRDYVAADAPRYDASADMGPRPRIALVLGGGGPRGFAHIGVLKALEANGIEPNMVVGTSVGAMIGALYADGHKAAELERIALDINPLKFVNFSMQGVNGSGDAVEDFINDLVQNKPIERLRRHFVAVAARLPDRRIEVFNVGNTGVAVRASSALPGKFLPTRIKGVDYMDGDEATPVPILAAHDLGADVIIAVDVSAYVEHTPPEVPLDWRVRDRRRADQVSRESGLANVLIHPDLGYYASIKDEYRRRSIALAERLTVEALPKIRASIARAEDEARARNAKAPAKA